MHTVTTGNMPAGQTWPYDGLYQQFLRMNVAMGGGWPGTPDGSQPNPMSMYVDYVRVYEYQPSTTPSTPSDMPASTGSEVLVNRVVGVTAEDGTVKVKTRTTGLGTSGKVRLKLGTDAAVSTNVVYSTPLSPSSLGDAIHTVAGLTRGTTYYYRVQMNSTTDSNSTVGRLVCFPTAATSFAFNFGSCSSVDDPAAFSAIKARADNLFLHLGDFWYADGTGANIDNFRNQMNTKLNTTNQGSMYASTPMAYICSDHDCAMVNNGLGADQPAALALFNQAYRENIPAPLVATTSGIYHTFTYGRVRFIMLDTRTFKSTAGATDNSSKTMLGTTQKAWLKNIIATSTSKVHIIATDVPWSGPTTVGADDWGGYNTERVEIGAALAASSLQAVFVSGDMHAVGHSSGTVNGRGYADLAAAPFNQNSSIKAAPWDAVYPASGSTAVSQYGRIVITDTGGATITLAFTGYSSDNTSRVNKTISFNG
jgi:phosphodiesterase/alkaline phosphatase D-like protein